MDWRSQIANRAGGGGAPPDRLPRYSYATVASIVITINAVFLQSGFRHGTDRPKGLVSKLQKPQELLVASAVNSEGFREILGICEGAKEDKSG
jgi:hypothetical protein